LSHSPHSVVAGFPTAKRFFSADESSFRSVRKLMEKIAICDATHEEAKSIVHMIRLMVTDMSSYGGYAPATDAAAWNRLAAVISEELKSENVRYVIAESADGEAVGVAGAELITLGGAFAPKKTLHISVVYVLPQQRRGGIGTMLLGKILDWGRAAGGVQCDLNVLSNNPARSLYEKLGFSICEVKMTRPL
jgi:ribosomal protein S18 acetylase RimI-like enzyme